MVLRLFCLLVYILTGSTVVLPQKVTLLFAGDAMQHKSQIDNAYVGGKYDYSSYFAYIKDEIEAADIAVVNLEVTLGGKPYTGYPTFSAPDEFAVALKNAGFDVFLTCNNHSADRHSKGINRTIDVLDSLVIRHTGTFKDQEERDRFYPMMMTKNGIRFAFLNYTYDTNGIDVKPPCIVNYIDEDQIKKDIRQAKLLNADMIIANMHWGDEYKLIQNKNQERLAKLLVDEGVDLVIGSHPHVIQPSKVIKDKNGKISSLVVYSLGNFVSGMKAVNTDGGQLVKVTVSKESYFHPKIDSCSYNLIYVDKHYNNARTEFRLIPVPSDPEKVDKTKQIPGVNYSKMAVFAKNARETFRKNNEWIEESLPDRPFWK